jgi:nucleoside-triphosphatase THEP1
MNTKNLLLTGPPGCGKSTLIEKLIARIDQPMTGFFTGELRDRGRRVGFSITTLCGKQGVLAHASSKSPVRVGKYGVNVEAIDQMAVVWSKNSNALRARHLSPRRFPQITFSISSSRAYNSDQ